MIKGFLAALALSACSLSISAAQDPPPATPPAQPPVTAPPPATPPPAEPQKETPVGQTVLPAVTTVPVTPPLDPETYRQRRRQIEIMEGVLAAAVKGAADEMASHLESRETGPYLMTGSHGARGFILDGYGVFFHVEIPGVQPSIVPLEALRRGLQPRQGPGAATPEPTSTSDMRTATAPAGSDADYVQRVTNALVDAMIKYSMPLELQAHEWFTVAASDGDVPLTPAFLVPRSTMILRLRGADIADYMTKRVTLEEIRKKVDVRKF